MNIYWAVYFFFTPSSANERWAIIKVSVKSGTKNRFIQHCSGKAKQYHQRQSTGYLSTHSPLQLPRWRKRYHFQNGL